MKYKVEDVLYTEIPLPKLQPASVPIDITDETIELHKEKVLKFMLKEKLDTLVIYADREHGSNFGYLTGFEPRFEEAVLVLHSSGKSYLLLGNESLRMAQFCRIPVEAVHVPYFSLPNQPMENKKTFLDLMESAKIQSGSSVGIVGWKMFTSAYEDNKQIYDVPSFIVDAVRSLVGEAGYICNASYMFINPSKGVRTIVNANEIAHFEYGASLASDCVLRALNTVELGKTELEIANELAIHGQPTNVQTICATGERFTNAIVAPRFKEVKLGDRFSMTMGFRGGLSSRSGYVVNNEEELPVGVKDYLDKVAKPYYAAATTWYSSIKIGSLGGELYDIIEEVFPKEVYGWSLNPGHLTAGEEWMSSPIYKGSSIMIKSGMVFQMDIIPSIDGYGGVSAEDGVVIADKELRKQLENEYPDVWGRICKRREYMQTVLGISLNPEILPLSNIGGYLRPFLLDKTRALKLVLRA